MSDGELEMTQPNERKEELKLIVEELEERIAPDSNGQNGYEGQPGNQAGGGGGNTGYEGQPGNQSHHH
jgi:hypothetical protein